MLNALLDEFINYLTVVKNYSPRTLPAYNSALKLFFRTMKITRPTQITPKIVEDYFALRIKQGLKHNSNFNTMINIRSFLKFCNKRGYTNVQLEMFEVPKRQRTQTEFVTPDEVNRMVDVIHRERDRLIMLVLFTSGCRISEITQMTIETFTDNKFTVIAKGNKPHVYYFDETVADRLRNYTYMEGITEGAIFRTTTGRPIGTPAVSHLVKKAARLANISHNVSPHQFRHGFATALLENGVDIRTAQEIMGHESVTTTMQYMHVTDKRMQESHERFAPKVIQSNFGRTPSYPQNLHHNR